MKRLKDWVEEVHIKVHRRIGDGMPDHKAGYYDWLVGFAVEKIIDEIKAEIPEMPSLIDLENRMKDIEYQMKAFKDRAEEILSKDAPNHKKEKTRNPGKMEEKEA